MSFHLAVYPLHQGHDSDNSSIVNDIGDVSFKEHSSFGGEDNSLHTTSDSSGAVDLYQTSPTVPNVGASAKESFGTQSASSSYSVGYLESAIGGAGEKNDEHWTVDLGDANGGSLQSPTGPTPTTRAFGIDDSLQNYAMTAMPFDFDVQASLNFTNSIYTTASVAEGTDHWANSPIIQGSLFDFSHISTSTIPRNSDSPGTDSIHNTQNYSSPGRNQPPTSQQNVTSVTPGISQSFPCGINGCSRSYHRKFELARHQRIHYGVRPYSCRFASCKRVAPNGFARKDHLKQHLRQVHKTSA